MLINKYTQPAKQTLIPTPMEQIWNSNRVMDQKDAAAQQFADTLNMNYFARTESRNTKRVDDQLARYDKATEGVMGANLLLSNIPHIPNDAEAVNKERDKILGVLSDTIDKYGDNPYVLNSTVAAVVNDVTRSMKSGSLSKILENVKRSEKLVEYHDKAMVNGEHTQASYQAALEAAKNAVPFPTLKGLNDDLSKQLSKFTMQNNIIAYPRVFEAAVHLMERDPRVNAMKSYMSNDEYQDYIIETARTYAMIEAGNRVSGKGGSTGAGTSTSGASGGAYNYSFPVEHDYGKTNIPVITPRKKEAAEEEDTRKRTLSLKMLYSIDDKEAKPGKEYLNGVKDADIKWIGHVPGGHMFLKGTLGEGKYAPNFSSGELWLINGKQFYEPMDDSQLNDPSGSGAMDVDLTEIGDADYQIQNSGSAGATRVVNSRATGQKLIVTKRGDKTVLRPMGGKATDAVEGSDFRAAYSQYIQKIKDNGLI